MSADLVVTNARVWTGEDGDTAPTAFAIAGGRIVAVGSADEIARESGPDTQTMDVGGAFVMPGLIDAHNHHSLAGLADLYELSIPPGSSVDEILSAVAAHAATLPDGAWIVGGVYGSDQHADINRAEVLARYDEASVGHPAILIEDSHHNRWVNSAAMARAGVKAGAPGVLLDSDGMPSGLLLEAAGMEVAKVQAAQAPYTPEQQKAASRRGIEMLNGFGITAFQDAAVNLPLLGALRALDESGELDAWVVSSLLVNDDIFGYDPIGEDLVFQGEPFRTEHHRPDFVKIFLDGVPPARTGAFLEPYLADDVHGAHFTGHTLMSPEELYDWLSRVGEHGLGAKIHCTGDGSAHLVLDTVQRLRDAGLTDMKVHIAHGQFLAETDIPRLAELTVTAEISPFIWFPGVIPDAIAMVLPAERAQRMQPNRALLDAGVLVAGGSDWPVSEEPNAWTGIEGLVTRADPTGSRAGTLWPAQAIRLDEAMRVFTINAARALGLEEVTGTLAPGKSADFIVLDRDPFTVAPDELADVTVRQTWFAGRRVYAA